MLAALGWWRQHPLPFYLFGTVGTLLAASALVVPTRLGPVSRGWMAFAHRLSRVTTPILLAVIYFVVLTPTGLVMRLFGRRPLSRSRDRATFWVPRTPAGRSDMQRQF